MTLGSLHFASAIVALILGAAVLWITPKGTRLHRRVGYAWVVNMLILNVSALMIYQLFGRFGPFHVAAVLSLATLLPGVLAAMLARTSRLKRNLERRARYLDLHYHLMTFCYVGLVAAAVSETATRLPATRMRPGNGAMFGLAVGLGTALVFAVGAYLVFSSSKRQLAAVGVRAGGRKPATGDDEP